MGHVIYCYIGCILDRVSCTKETLSDFLLNYGSRSMGHDGVALSCPTPTGFRKVTGCQRDPRDKGVTRREVRVATGAWLRPRDFRSQQKIVVSQQGILCRDRV